MNALDVEVFGPEPPCPRCRAVEKAVREAASKMGSADINVKKLNIMDREVVRRYGVLVSPALAINGIVKVMGRVPSVAEVEALLKEASSK
ncbi:MAG: thioredoxin family protein [Candidatus Bathyarchaeia archaeon]